MATHPIHFYSPAEREEWIRLQKIERICRAIVSYNTNEDLAANLAAASDGGPTYSEEGVVRKVWVNHKLAASFKELREALGL